MTRREDPKPAGILERLGVRTRWKRARANSLLPPPRTACVYVDVENLNDAEHAQAVMETVIRDWRDTLPPVRRLNLYTPADRAGLWGAWAPARFPDLRVDVRPIQRFARRSKNAADMAIVADASADFAAGVVNYIAVVSNDSDFGALFVKIQELAGRTEPPPFLWITLSGGSGLSREIEGFIPKRLRWAVPAPPAPATEMSSKLAEDGGAQLPSNRRIVGWLMDELPPGKFRAEDVREILERHCPGHPAAQSATACGSFLAQQLMPLLEKRKVSVVRRKPRTYERTG
ncbi:MAG: NYN domain-containing protein [Defluviicoccus sp.]|nr:NYN domain-containing protein [Defluviicoccus sp.]MDE0276570.1 NYN domain-containing protein [Defluviicoccus sp.]